MAKRPAQRGVTFVELLVTIVLVGIFFAALVPVFVMASRSSSVDRTRVAALNIAQSRIEAIRSLAYDSITLDPALPDNLTAREADTSTGRDLRFDGPWKSPGSEAKVYKVTYAVKDVTGTVATDPQQYKVVTVTVTWDGAPNVGKPVILRTAVYRQAYGPEATGLRVYTDAQPNASQTFWTSPIKAAVTIAPLDRALVDYVRFIVYANNGSQIAGETVSNYETGSTGWPRATYEWTWVDSGAAPDGAYTFAAVAVAADSEQTGGMWQKPIYLDHQIPTAPTWPKDDAGAVGGIVAGANAVMVTWQPVTAGDLSYYEVERWRVGGAAPDATFDKLPRWSTTLVDGRALESSQSYYYLVCATDESGQQGAWSARSLAATPGAATASAVEAPASLSASQLFGTASDETTRQRQLNLDWPASANDVTGGTVKYYFVYRSQLDPPTTYVDAGSDWNSPLRVLTVTTPTARYSAPDATVDWRGLYQYRVAAVDAHLNESAETPSPSVTVLLPTGDFYLTVHATADPALIGKNQKWYARLSIVSLDTGEVYPKPWGITQIADKLWVNGSKPYVQQLTIVGRYQVVASFYTQTGGYKGTNSMFIDVAETRDVTVPYAAPQ